jgi:hypothetical protein
VGIGVSGGLHLEEVMPAVDRRGEVDVSVLLWNGAGVADFAGHAIGEHPVCVSCSFEGRSVGLRGDIALSVVGALGGF